MSNKFSPMKLIDEKLHEAIQNFKMTPQYDQLSEFYTNLEEVQKDLFKLGMLAIVLIIPGIMLLGTFVFSNSTQSELLLKEKIIATAGKIIYQKQQTQTDLAKALGREIPSQGALNNLISRSVSRAGIDSKNIRITDYELIEEEANINKISAKLNINNFSDKNLYDFIRNTIIFNKFKVIELDIKKDQKTNLLKGFFNIEHISKAVIGK